jgi:hypothetical protein
VCATLQSCGPFVIADRYHSAAAGFTPQQPRKRTPREVRRGASASA